MDPLTVIRQEVVSKKDIEINMIKTILDGLDIKGSVVTIDAIGCQKQITKDLCERGADYLTGLKKNQPNLHNEVLEYFDFTQKNKIAKESFDIHQRIDKGHGRIENRSYFCLDTKHFPSNVPRVLPI